MTETKFKCSACEAVIISEEDQDCFEDLGFCEACYGIANYSDGETEDGEEAI